MKMERFNVRFSLVRVMRNRPGYFAHQLKKALKVRLIDPNNENIRE